METIGALLIIVVPLVVTPLVSLIKRLPLIKNLPDRGTYAWTIRVLVFVLSLLGVGLTYMQTGVVDETALNTLVMALLSTLASMGVHELGDKK